MNEMLNKVTLGDCLDVMKNKLPDNSIDLIITDPPYGVDFADMKFYDDRNVFDKYDEWVKEMHRVMKDNSHIYVFIPTIEIDKWVCTLKKHFIINNILATQSHMNGKYNPCKFSYDVQLVVYASKGVAKHLNNVDWVKTSDVWLKDKRNLNPKEYTYKYPSFIDFMKSTKKRGKNKNFHPNEKNEDFIQKLIEISSNKGDIVLDPFAGSSSTGLAAKNCDRNFICIEQKEEFYKISNSKLGIKTLIES